MNPRRRRFLALAAGALFALPTAAAQADSIVYIDGGNVWSAAPDGSKKVQLTDGGQWHSPTQSDDGTIAAVQGSGPIQVMTGDGRPLRTITTPTAKSGDGGTFAPRPVGLSFSPDGSKIAYSYVANSCPVASTCGTIQRSTFYTAADVTEATPITTYGNQYGVSDPEWVTNSRALVFGGAGSQVSIDDLNVGDYNFKPWMTPAADQGDGEVSRDGKHLATTFFYGKDTIIAFFAVKGDIKTETPPAQPDVACNTTPADEKYADPTWSPDGMGIAYESAKGIEVARFSKLDASGCAADDGPLLSASGSEPDWGPANPPAKRWTAPVDPKPTATPTATTTATPTATPTVKPTTPAVTYAGAAKATRQALRKGLKVRVNASAPGAVSVKLVARGKTVATGTAKATAAGSVTIKLGKARKAKKGKAKLVITLSPSAGAPVTVTKALTIK